ncbi:type II restriction enzyme [Jeotgalibaca caeni]|uniref:type II restriction enzyme n=1 Tax=Jeotgalibaca caeni TaxID=3028623 RepID=UPI00237DA78B|nr:AAA-associated domain-containing protein [Jeotgalibaca caeni]MDE1549981.1 AAA-associated domain-containing protein [Jeotgalibaca caeni]
MTKKSGRNSERKIDKNWNEIFEKYNILNKIEDEGKFIITSAQINEFKEARLMTKFDYVNSLPDLFFHNGLSILPITRGSYVIGKFNAYSQIDDSKNAFRQNINKIPFPDWIETLDYQSITSESSMLNVAYISGMVHELFGVEKVFQTISGRRSSESFTFNIQGTDEKDRLFKIDVENSQLEVDAGFETEKNLVLVEAKNNKTSSFLIRQLYYPYRLWTNKVCKKVTPVFLQYENGIYNFSVFDFEDVNNYNSIKLLYRKNYIIDEGAISMRDIEELLMNKGYVPEPKDIPFPQANNFLRVVEMLTTIDDSIEGKVSLEDLTLQNDFVYRQAQYYSRAAIYLGLAKLNSDSTVSLTNLGNKLVNSGVREKRMILIRQILSHKPFAILMKARIKKRGRLSPTEIHEIIKEHSLLSSYQYSAVTEKRRGSTINAWIEEILSMVESV